MKFTRESTNSIIYDNIDTYVRTPIPNQLKLVTGYQLAGQSYICSRWLVVIN